MASLVKCVLFSFLLALLFSARIQARESRFFSKFMHFGTTDVDTFKESISEVPIGAPTSAPAPGPVVTEAESGYGLYGPGSGMMSPTKEITATNDENELLNEELDGVTFEKSYQNRNYDNNGYTNNNDGYQLASKNYETGNQNNNGYTTSSNYNNNGYTTSNYYNNGYELASGSYETGTQNNKNGYYNNNVNYYTNNNNNGYETERQGMSDTRFVEDGKSYYDVKNEKYSPTTEKLSTQNQGYYGDSNTEYSNEFNTMEFENQDKYEESQEQEP